MSIGFSRKFLRKIFNESPQQRPAGADIQINDLIHKKNFLRHAQTFLY
jgi:hypothetical protein